MPAHKNIQYINKLYKFSVK